MESHSPFGNTKFQDNTVWGLRCVHGHPDGSECEFCILIEMVNIVMKITTPPHVCRRLPTDYASGNVTGI